MESSIELKSLCGYVADLQPIPYIPSLTNGAHKTASPFINLLELADTTTHLLLFRLVYRIPLLVVIPVNVFTLINWDRESESV